MRLGGDYVRDVRRISSTSVDVIFDVGANDGQSARRFLKGFRTAKIVCFEPFSDAYQRLQQLAAPHSRITTVRAACGAEPGRASLFRFGLDQTNSLLPKAEGADSYLADPDYMAERGNEQVDVISVDAYCETHNITSIDLLKIDTQGYEIEVLKGARQMLSSNAIRFVYAEVCFVPYYVNQPLFQDVYEYLFARGFRLVGLYETGYLTHFYQVGGNALFVHHSIGSIPNSSRSIRLGPITWFIE